MTNRFKSSLAYTGVAQPTPPNEVVMDRSPTANDYQSFNIGDIWIVPTRLSAPSQQMWVLMSKAQNQAIWVDVSAGGAATYNNHELLVGTGTSTINTINNSTAGLPLLTQGASADPTWGVLAVPGGGTGSSSYTANSIIVAGATSTSALTSISTVGVAGQVLHSQGAGLPPVWQGTGPVGAITNINVQYKTTPGAGTYTPTAGMVQCIVECVGGGGGSGGASFSPLGSEALPMPGAGSGSYARKLYTVAQIGAGVSLEVGAGGLAGGIGASGGTGGATTFDSGSVSAGGGIGGPHFNVSYSSIVGSYGGTATGGDVNVNGQQGDNFASAISGWGASNIYGTGGYSQTTAGMSPNTYRLGLAGTGYGSGAGGLIGSFDGTPGTFDSAGTAGQPGLIIITEYLN